MKNILLIAIALITVNATAQEEKKERQLGDRMERAEFLKDLSPKEMATLQTKKMTLLLDLTEAQQKEIQAIHLEQAKKRKTQMEARKKMAEKSKDARPSKDERFKQANAILDDKIAVKSKMKTILNKEQYEKWEKSNAKRGRQREMKRGKPGQRKMSQKRRKQKN